ncbi:MAG: hypothetical protein V5A48_04080, partial [Salinivenus sp.]
EFRLGGGRDRPDPEPEPLPGPSPVGAAPEAPPADTGEAGGRRGMDPTDLTPVERRLLARVDSLERALQGNAAQAADAGPPRSNVSDRTMTVPVPEEGEIYVRFGGDTQESRPVRADTTTRAAGAGDRPLTSEQIRRRVERTLRQQLRRQQGADSVQANIEQIVDRALRNALRDRQRETSRQEGQSQQIQRLQDQIEQLRRDLRAQQSAEPGSAQQAAASPPFYRELLSRPLTYIVPVTGYRGGDGLSQFQIGVRGDYRTGPSSKFHLVPELTFGVGGSDGLSPNLLANVAYSFFRDRVPALTGQPLGPYVGAGVGVASTGGLTFEPVLNAMIGADYRVRGRQAVFLEYSTLDLGDAHRVHVGYRIRF